MNDTVESKVIGIVAESAGIDPATIKPESTLKDLGVASLDAIEIIFDIEQAFDLNLPDKQPDFDNDTVQGLIDAVHEATAAKQATIPH